MSYHSYQAPRAKKAVQIGVLGLREGGPTLVTLEAEAGAHQGDGDDDQSVLCGTDRSR